LGKASAFCADVRSVFSGAAISRRFFHAGASQGANPHVGGGVIAVESPTPA
jgi:hypothetical protein